MSDHVVLGLCAFTHDSSAALIVDGHLVGFVEEERLNQQKHTKDYPALGVDWLLAEAALTAADVTDVAYNFDGRQHLRPLGGLVRELAGRATRHRAVPRAASFVRVYRNYRQRISDLEKRFCNSEVTSVEHHRCHGIYAFESSGFDNSAVLIVDSLGESTSTSIAQASHDAGRVQYREVGSVADPASLGYAYGAVTEHLGWRRGSEEGTVMALAATGDPARFRAVFAQAIQLHPNGLRLDPDLLALRVLDRRYERTTNRFAELTCPRRRPDEPVTHVHADLAAALQERTEQAMLHLAHWTAELTGGADRLCLSGGVAANCVSVGRIINEGTFNEVYVPPAPGDSGTAIGAAIDQWSALTGTAPTGVAGRCYLGPSFHGIALGQNPRHGLVAHQPPDLVEVLAKALAAGQIVGLFTGAVEAGPRALCHRSILASPIQPGVVDRLNRDIKRREPFRPFAPVVATEAASHYFELRQPAPYMSVAAAVTDRARTVIPAVVHDNGTARVQTLSRDDHPFMAAVLDRFGEMTGVPVLINTSLNVKGKPICGTPEMALDCLVEANLDALVLEDWWVESC